MCRNAQYHIKAIEELYEEEILAANQHNHGAHQSEQNNQTVQYMENKRRPGSSSTFQLSYWLEEMYSYKTPVQIEKPDNEDGREQEEMAKLFPNRFFF